MQESESQLQRSQGGRPLSFLAIAGGAIAAVAIGHWFFAHQTPIASVGDTSAISGALAVVAAMLVITSALVLVRSRELSAASAARDPVTGLYTRGYADEVIATLMARDDRAERSQLALVLIRIDHLAPIRRRYGQSAVDHAMQFIGGQILGQVRAGDVAVRHADHWVAVFLQCDEIDQAVSFGRRVAMLLSAQQLDWRGEVIKISVSMGVVLRLPGEPLSAVCRRADRQLDEAVRSEQGRIAA
jgi:diguanylate cyclase (GGDEF)-like protein